MFGSIVGAYVLANVAASVQLSVKERMPGYLLTMPVAFAGSHLAYGLGGIWGLAKALMLTASRVFKRNEADLA